MDEESFLHRGGADVPEDARRGVRRLAVSGSESEGLVEAENFHEYENLERLELREGVLKVGRRAFCGCRRLGHVASPSSLRAIEDEAFAGCPISKMNLSEGLQSIGSGAFVCHSFEQIIIPSTVREIRLMAFGGGKNLSKVTLAGGTVLLGRYAFHGCPQLKNIATPPKVIVVEDRKYGNGRAEVVTGGTIKVVTDGPACSCSQCGSEPEPEPTRLILTSPYLASMKSEDVERVKDAINRIVGAGPIRSRFRGLLLAINQITGGPPRGEGPLDLPFGMAGDSVRALQGAERVRRGAERIRSCFLGLLSAHWREHRRAIASILERSPFWESEGGGVEPGVVGIILSFLGDIEG